MERREREREKDCRVALPSSVWLRDRAWGSELVDLFGSLDSATVC